MDRLY